ncbi:MAG TPA: hypothetical protein DCG32_05410 [Sphaerochaeta sp.]|nr:hypothetical protein [Sphaerochaeta sp.]
MNIDTLFLTPAYLPLLSATLLMVTKAFWGERGRNTIQTLGSFIALKLQVLQMIHEEGSNI